MMKKAAGDAYKVCLANPQWDAKLVLSVHDELVYEIYEEYIDEALPQIQYAMEHAIKLVVPTLVDIGYGDNYAIAKG